MEKLKIEPGALFEISWEICNKVGGIHTVISTKTPALLNNFKGKYVLIGPDIWRDEDQNPEFEPDPELFKEWKLQFRDKAFAVKTGRWKVEGKPIVLLIDFYPLIGKKDEIFSLLWEHYKLDSISGQWDYIEPALFGYAAGQVIEDICSFYEGFQQNAIAHFHEWMTGGGVLYLKENAPHIGTVFTTHATALGRSIAGNNRPLYSKMKDYHPARMATEFGMASKQSLESLSARNADGFSTVSEITARECIQFLGKKPDVITPNGFEDSFVPPADDFENKRRQAKIKLLSVAKNMGHKIQDDAFLIATSGRYEFRNKGLDLFIDALAGMSGNSGLTKQIIAFILVPAGTSGPRKDLNDASQGIDQDENMKYLTHILQDPESDPVLNFCKEKGLDNSDASRVKIIFTPSYLNGNDGVFNMNYYDLLIGFDLTVFPSYYEPWGYTPLESLAFHIPAVTTSLAGFGRWVDTHVKDQGDGIRVLKRTDGSYGKVVVELANAISHYAALTHDEMALARTKAFEISRVALWENLVIHYFKLYARVLETSGKRYSIIELPQPGERSYTPPVELKDGDPVWRELFVESRLPDGLSFLKELAGNLWWSWNHEAIALWESTDPVLWEECQHNPVELIEKVNYKRLLVLQKDDSFMSRLENVDKDFRNYMDIKPGKNKPLVAYFSMEYGLHDSLKIFSGGLGILAGDYLKEASDSNANIVAIGLLYRYGYFKQVLTINGEQTAAYHPEHFSRIPVFPVRDETGERQTITIVFPGRDVTAYLWKVNVGRINLYLLDTDHEINQLQDRSISHNLYGGDLENRLKQEILLGIGGIRALRKLNIQPDIYHSNEGHSAFIGLERLRHFISEHGLSFDEALEVVRASALFTTHTPVPAGHDMFPEDLVRTYMSHYPERLNISWDRFMELGQHSRQKRDEDFNMSFLAARLSLFMNGVSKLHGSVSRELFKDLWPGYLPSELPIGYVTNGVHYKTWTHPDWIGLFKKHTGTDWGSERAPMGLWRKIKDIENEEIWSVKQHIKSRMIDHIKRRLTESWTKRKESPKYILEIVDKLNDKALTIGFARRFATYKRAHLLFKDLERLDRIVNHSKRPVQFIFAGKAHPNDKAGQDLIKNVIQISKRPEFLGKILFLQNYDMTLAAQLVQGMDVWLNTPTRPLEASGTSGEKAVMNGTLHFSVLDGWWSEGYKPNAGWAISEKRTYDNQDFQDELDAETIYNLLESEIIPSFYKRNRDGVSDSWVGFVKNSMTEVAPDFTMSRMLDDYINKYYNPLHERSIQVQKQDFSQAKSIAGWKKRINAHWNQVEVLSLHLSGDGSYNFVSGQEYLGEISIDFKELDPEDIGIELIVSKDHECGTELIHRQDIHLQSFENGKAIYKASIIPTQSGGFNFGFRMYPRHPKLPHRQDFPLVRWF